MPAVALAQTDPVPVLSARWGQTAAEARRKTESLVATLRELDQVAADLEGHGLTVDVDLGPIGNAAAAARRDLDRENPLPTFALPKPR